MRSLCLIVYFTIISQVQTIENSFYNLKLPRSTVYEKMRSLNEKSANAVVFKIINSDDEQVKYLMYLMANKLNTEMIIASQINQYAKDLGDLKVVNSKIINLNNNEFYKVNLEVDDNIKGIMYLTSRGDVLYRMVFMIPKKNSYKYEEELIEIISKTYFLQNKW